MQQWVGWGDSRVRVVVQRWGRRRCCRRWLQRAAGVVLVVAVEVVQRSTRLDAAATWVTR